MKLNDAVLRERLRSYLLNQYRPPRKIIEELHVHKGNAIADIVALYKNDAHCFEIKGETDKIARIESQGQYYNLAFKKITLVTTENHIQSALNKAPDFWGLIVASSSCGQIRFRNYRRAMANPMFNKEVALYTLWRQEMLKLSEASDIELPSKGNKLDFAAKIANSLSVSEVSLAIADSLFQR